MNYLAKNLRWLRKQTVHIQASISFCIGATRGTYGHYETGYCEPSVEHLRQLSLFYDVSIDYLVRKDLSLLNPVEIRIDFNLIQEQLAEIDLLNAGMQVI